MSQRLLSPTEFRTMLLTDAAVTALLTTVPAGHRIAVFFRPAKGGRWRRVFTAPDYASAVARIDGPGSWWLHELPDADDGPTLFDTDDEVNESEGGSR